MAVKYAQPMAVDKPRGGATRELILTPDRIKAFIGWHDTHHRAAVTLERYEKDLMQLYLWLPGDKELTLDRLRQWKRTLLMGGYAGRTINSKISAINSYLAFEERRELQLMDFEKNEVSTLSLSREEYLRLLKAARDMPNQKLYLLVKVFGTMGLPIQHLSALTVEALEKGAVKTSGGTFAIPACLCGELKAYAETQDLKSGPIFLTRGGSPLNRTTVASFMKRLSGPARVDEEKISSRCLRKMYQDTRTAFLQDVEHLVQESYERLLEEEQQLTGWESQK